MGTQLLSQSTIEVMPRLCQWMALAEEVVSGHSSDTAQKWAKKHAKGGQNRKKHIKRSSLQSVLEGIGAILMSSKDLC